MWLQQDLEKRPKDAADSGDTLDRALIAGLLLEVILQEPELPGDPRQRQQRLKARLGAYLVEHLAGRVSLDRFRSLARNLERWFAFYYPLVVGPSPDPSDYSYRQRETASVYGVQEEREVWLSRRRETLPQETTAACREEVLAAQLDKLQEYLPKRSHAKLTVAKLKEFFHRSAGGWFRLRDFERFLQIDRKTAWDYLQQFLQWGLLCHNRRQSTAVRYCLDPMFLKVAADTLRLALALALPEFPEETVEAVGDLLVASGGEPFPLSYWQEKLPADSGAEILTILRQREILLPQSLGSGVLLLRLHPRWLQEASPAPDPPAALPLEKVTDISLADPDYFRGVVNKRNDTGGFRDNDTAVDD